MPRRAVIAMLTPVPWAPPGIAADRWRAALAEDVVDLLAGLAQVDAAIAATAADRELAAAVAWPGMPLYVVPRLTARAVLDAAAADGYDEAALLAADVPDLPGLLVAKLMRPLSSRTVAVAAAVDGRGLLGVASRLPVPPWLPDLDLDSGSLDKIRAVAPRPAQVGTAPVWRRLRGAADLATLDPGLDGWPATRALLSGR
jgi:hypothetical protein